MTKAIGSGLILPVRVGKYIDKFIQKLVMNTEQNRLSAMVYRWLGRLSAVLGDGVGHIANSCRQSAQMVL